MIAEILFLPNVCHFTVQQIPFSVAACFYRIECCRALLTTSLPHYSNYSKSRAELKLGKLSQRLTAGDCSAHVPTTRVSAKLPPTYMVAYQNRLKNPSMPYKSRSVNKQNCCFSTAFKTLCKKINGNHGRIAESPLNTEPKMRLFAITLLLWCAGITRI